MNRHPAWGAGVALVVIAGTAGAAPDKSLAVAPATSPAAAVSEPPDRAAMEAADANLESTAGRRGVTFSASLGPGLIIGFGIQDSIGNDGSVALRLGHVATRRTVIAFEIAVTAALHRPTLTSAVEPNTNTNLLIGAQHYVNPSLWVHGAAGVGVYQTRQAAGAEGQLADITLVGPAILGGAGIDMARFRSMVLFIEVSTSAMVNRDGVLVASGLDLGLSFD